MRKKNLSAKKKTHNFYYKNLKNKRIKKIYLRFKNNLAWQDRLYLYINRPKSLYNSEYKIWIIRSGAIYSRKIYANRLPEILKLNERSLLFINYLELQDFLLSRLNEVIFFISKGTKYFLSSVIGQTVGLIWRGIVESLKN